MPPGKSTTKSHDSLNRRHRTRPQSTGKRVSPQARDLLWFRKLHEHGPLSTSFLHAFSKHLCKSEKRAKDRLTDLFNEAETPHNGTYLTRPWQQFQTFDSRYQQLVYDLAPSAEKVLKQEGHWHDSSGGASGPWKHRYMVAAITASIEIATLERDDLTYIPQHAILERAETTLRYPVPFENPSSGKTEIRNLIPDALFGLEYKTPKGSRFRFFIVEADRGTEPTRASKFNRKSHLRNFLQYREYVGRGLYKEHLGLTAGMLVLNVTSKATTMLAMQHQLQEISSGGNSFQLFRCHEEFGRMFRATSPEMSFLSGEWETIERDGFDISK